MSKSRIALCAAAAVAVLAAAPAYAGELIVNGGFETGVLSPWLGLGSADVTTESQYNDCCGFTSTRPDNHVAAFGGGGNYPSQSISQSFTSEIGRLYLLTFDMAAVGSENLNTVDVSVGGVSQHFDLHGITDFDQAYTHQSLAFTGTGADTVTFTIGSSFNDDVDTVIDNVSIGVPEPASWALMIVGFGLTGAALRRRRVLVPVRA